MSRPSKKIMENELKNIKDLLERVELINYKYETINQENNFEVFTILYPAHYEVNLHTRFLAEMLNPYGEHLQEDAFLKLFVDRFINNTWETETKEKWHFDIENTWVERERKNIDILISNNKNQAIIIENKIRAGDQDKQLERYSNLKEDQDHKVIYLTLDGKRPSENSVGNLKEVKKILCIAYNNKQNDEDRNEGDENDKKQNSKKQEENFIDAGYCILDWIKDCIKECATKPALRETFVQYERLIRKLTRDTMTEKQKGEVAELLKKDGEWDNTKLETFKSLLDAKNEIGKAFEKKLWADLKERLQEDLEDKKIELKDGSFVHWTSQKKNLWSDNIFILSNGLKFLVGVVKGKDIFCGFVGKNDEKIPFSNKGLLDNIKLEFLAKKDKLFIDDRWYIGFYCYHELIHFDRILYDEKTQKEFFKKCSDFVQEVVAEYEKQKPQ